MPRWPMPYAPSRPRSAILRGGGCLIARVVGWSPRWATSTPAWKAGRICRAGWEWPVTPFRCTSLPSRPRPCEPGTRLEASPTTSHGRRSAIWAVTTTFVTGPPAGAASSHCRGCSTTCEGCCSRWTVFSTGPTDSEDPINPSRGWSTMRRVPTAPASCQATCPSACTSPKARRSMGRASSGRWQPLGNCSTPSFQYPPLGSSRDRRGCSTTSYLGSCRLTRTSFVFSSPSSSCPAGWTATAQSWVRYSASGARRPDPEPSEHECSEQCSPT